MIESYYGIYKFTTSLGEVCIEIDKDSRFEENIELFDGVLNEDDTPIYGSMFYDIKIVDGERVIHKLYRTFNHNLSIMLLNNQMWCRIELNDDYYGSPEYILQQVQSKSTTLKNLGTPNAREIWKKVDKVAEKSQKRHNRQEYKQMLILMVTQYDNNMPIDEYIKYFENHSCKEIGGWEDTVKSLIQHYKSNYEIKYHITTIKKKYKMEELDKIIKSIEEDDVWFTVATCSSHNVVLRRLSDHPEIQMAIRLCDEFSEIREKLLKIATEHYEFVEEEGYANRFDYALTAYLYVLNDNELNERIRKDNKKEFFWSVPMAGFLSDVYNNKYSLLKEENGLIKLYKISNKTRSIKNISDYTESGLIFDTWVNAVLYLIKNSFNFQLSYVKCFQNDRICDFHDFDNNYCPLVWNTDLLGKTEDFIDKNDERYRILKRFGYNFMKIKEGAI